MAIPGNVDASACDRLGLRRVGMDEIVRSAHENRRARESETASARQLVDEALPRVRERFAERVYAPMYGALQEHYREVAIEGVGRLLAKELQGLGGTERKTVSTWAEGLARRLAHLPIQGVRGLLHHGPEGSLDAFLEGLGPDLKRQLLPSGTGRRPAAAATLRAKPS